jgi:glutathione S-transferase
MILVGQYDSPFVRRVGITLHLYGLPFERNTISVFNNAEEMARINPLVRIPSLVLDNGEVLVDSVAILDYLDELAGPEKALMPRSGSERRHILQIIAMAIGSVDKAGAIVYERFFHHPAHVNQDLIARFKTQLAGGLDWLEERLKDDWFFGGKISQADVSVGASLGYMNLRLPEAFADGRHPRLARFSAKCEAMEAFKATRPASDEIMHPLKT